MPNGDLYSAIRDDGIGRFAWTRKPGPSGRPLPNTGLNRRIALDIARGLHFLHSRRVVHLDLKSPNILLARDFTAKGKEGGGCFFEMRERERGKTKGKRTSFFSFFLFSFSRSLSLSDAVSTLSTTTNLTI